MTQTYTADKQHLCILCGQKGHTSSGCKQYQAKYKPAWECFKTKPVKAKGDLND